MQSDSAGQAVAIAWNRETAQAPWTRRDSMGWAVFQDKMWFLGGFIPTRVNDVWSSSDGVNWEEVTPAAPWAARNLPCTLVYDDKIWIFAGADNPHVSYNDVWCSADGKHWEAATLDAPWGKRSAASAVVFDGRMWLFGGFDIAKFHHYQDVWTSIDGKNWDLVEEHAPWSARSMQTSVVFDGKMWLMGGGVYNTNYPYNTVVNHNDVWCTTDGKSWEMVAVAAAWQERRFHASAVYDDKMWIIGGHTHGNRNDVWFSSDGANWVEAKGDPIWPIRHAPVCLDLPGQTVGDRRLWRHPLQRRVVVSAIMGMQITAGPYLQNVARDAITIMWHTDEPATSLVEYEKSARLGWSAYVGRPEPTYPCRIEE